LQKSQKPDILQTECEVVFSPTLKYQKRLDILQTECQVNFEPTLSTLTVVFCVFFCRKQSEDMYPAYLGWDFPKSVIRHHNFKKGAEK